MMSKPKPPENVTIIHNDLFGWLRWPWWTNKAKLELGIVKVQLSLARGEVIELQQQLRILERIHSGELVDESHVDWRVDEEIRCMNFPDMDFMAAYCVHCGHKRSGIDAMYKGNRYFKIHCSGNWPGSGVTTFGCVGMNQHWTPEAQ